MAVGWETPGTEEGLNARQREPSVLTRAGSVLFGRNVWCLSAFCSHSLHTDTCLQSDRCGTRPTLHPRLHLEYLHSAFPVWVVLPVELP